MQTEAIPESRTYRHSKCNEETTISGQPFEVMSNPLSDMTRTWCTQCNDYFPISEYAWSDTGESIPDYYARHSANASSLQRFLCSKKCMIFLALTGFLLVAIVAFVLFASSALWLRIVLAIVGGLFGAFVGCAVYISALCGPITRKVCGVEDTRILK